MADIVSRFGPRVEGTCDWITKHGKYQSWLQAPCSSLLWICGGPATGKTYLSVFLVGELEKTVKGGVPNPHDNELLAYFFCSQEDQKRNTPGGLLRGLIYLLLQVKPDLIDCMLEDFSRLKSHNSLFDPSNKEALWRNFEQMLLQSGLDKIYFVLDALDECAGDSLQWLLQKLTSLVSPNMPTQRPILRMVIAARPVPDVRKYLYKFPKITAGQDDHLSHDLRLFVSSKIEDLAEKQSAMEEENKRAIVKEKWLAATKPLRMFATETFLWVSFVIRDLEQCYLPEVEEKLRTLPHGLDGYYERMLHQISQQGQHQEIIARVIRWVAMAVRPLTLVELSIATDILPTESHSQKQEMMESYVNRCGYFLKVNHGTVSLIHQSARDYLTRIHRDQGAPRFSLFRIDEAEAHLQIAQTCLKYIQGGFRGVNPFAGGRTIINLGRSQPNLESPEVQAFPLLQYAALNWAEHARCSSREAAIFDLSEPFFQAKSPVRQTWLHSYWRTTMPDWPPPDESFGLIHMSSFFGLKAMMEALLARENPLKRIFSSTVNQKSDLDMMPLHWAVRNGHESVAKLLVDHGADIDAKGYGLTPLIWAVRNGRESIAKMLLDHNAEINEKGYGMTALHWAAREGRESFVRLLLDRGADSSVRTTSHTIGDTSGEVAISNAVNREFPWATVDEANAFSLQAQAEDRIISEKRDIKISVIVGAFTVANISSLSVMYIHDRFSIPWAPPSRALLLTLITTTLGGLALGTAIAGTGFLLGSLLLQGYFALTMSLGSWYCGAFRIPFSLAARPTTCGNFYFRVIVDSLWVLVCVAMCVGAACLSGEKVWVGKYQWAWYPFVALWWIGLVACVMRRSAPLALYWGFVGFTVMSWGIATTAALSKDPPLGKTAAQMALLGGFVELAQLLEESEKGSTALKAAETSNDPVSCDDRGPTQ
ncbi:hypothetical protein AYL99_11577 [Fonsecaea erecta]|uniref:Uncharacterized protein n=1 Tax=Fonsecaea erecta TaxID=1367422 RepID=A0A178Z4R9_9EURO|nr:hypothetical protein AYL99_11577 [Fonsecaea erecta]OAP54476.1 hypothetical protein AYL99_11577 [Fonsecaea erecta]